MGTGKPHLVRLDTQEIIPVDRKLTLGRHPDCDCVVTINNQSAAISGRHASIEVDGEYAWIEDMGSTNGTWVRGARIAQRTPLLPGERFLLDRLEFEYRAAVPSGAAPAAPVMEKTVFAGRHEAQLPPVPVRSPQSAAPRLAPAPLPARPAPQRVAPMVASQPAPRGDAAASIGAAVPERVMPARPLLLYVVVALGLAALAVAGFVLSGTRS